MLPYDGSAAATERGGALFVSAGGRSRTDNPELHSVLYVAANPQAAIAETFGRLPLWTPETFVHGSGKPYAVAAYDVPDDIAIFGLDDIDAPRSIGITRPTNVVTRDRSTTQAWARTIFGTGRYAGVKWRSYYNPDWPVRGLWEFGEVRIAGIPGIITSMSPVVDDTASTMVRQIMR